MGTNFVKVESSFKKGKQNYVFEFKLPPFCEGGSEKGLFKLSLPISLVDFFIVKSGYYEAFFICRPVISHEIGIRINKNMEVFICGNPRFRKENEPLWKAKLLESPFKVTPCNDR